MRSLAEDLVEAGQLAPALAEDFVGHVECAAPDGRFEMSLKMHAIVAVTPGA